LNFVGWQVSEEKGSCQEVHKDERLIYLLKQSFKDPSNLVIILICISTPIAVEIIQVAQFGRNYFSWLIGIIFIITFAFYHIYHSAVIHGSKRTPKLVILLFITFLIVNGSDNYQKFMKDVYPSRMANNIIYDWIKNNPPKNLYSYPDHPYRLNMIDLLVNIKQKDEVKFRIIQHLPQAIDGYIFIPPLTGKSIWSDCQTEDFVDDPYLVQLIRSGRFSQYVIRTFNTLTSSRIWAQEEEYCSYLDLHLNKISDFDRFLGHAFILDAEKLRREEFKIE